MKKVYLLAIVLLAFSTISNAQIEWKAFYGPVAQVPTTNEEMNLLPNSLVDDTTNSVFILNTGKQFKTFVIALPIMYDIQYVSDLDASGVQVASLFSIIASPNISNSYKLYKMSLGGAYSMNHRYEVTITKTANTTGISDDILSQSKTFSIYNIDGVMVASNVSDEEIKNLNRGLYIKISNDGKIRQKVFLGN